MLFGRYDISVFGFLKGYMRTFSERNVVFESHTYEYIYIYKYLSITISNCILIFLKETFSPLGMFCFPWSCPIDNVTIMTPVSSVLIPLTAIFLTKCFVRSSLDRMQLDQIGIGQLHWSTANYAPLQEKALWDGLVAMYEKVTILLVPIRSIKQSLAREFSRE